MLETNWRQCGSDQHWCDLFLVDLPAARFRGVKGVYLIWHEGSSPQVLCVRYGDLRACIDADRKDPRILAYTDQGPLYVTWAIVESAYLKGVTQYLIELTRPLMVDEVLNGEPIEVHPPCRWMRRRSPAGSS
jgi:hypothetical protein